MQKEVKFFNVNRLYSYTSLSEEVNMNKTLKLFTSFAEHVVVTIIN